MEDETIESHDSYGMVGLYRTSGDPGPLFGSSIRHNNFIALRISRARRRRSLSNHWYSAGAELIEVRMSSTQFADLITSFGHGDGHPCTIRHVGRVVMPPCPDYDQREQFVAEFQASCRKAMEAASAAVAEARELLSKPTITKADRKAIIGKIEAIEMQVRSNLPFVHDHFNEAMDKTVTECKGEVEAFVQQKVSSLGLEALREQFGGHQIEAAGQVPMLPGVEEQQP